MRCKRVSHRIQTISIRGNMAYVGYRLGIDFRISYSRKYSTFFIFPVFSGCFFFFFVLHSSSVPRNARDPFFIWHYCATSLNPCTFYGGASYTFIPGYSILCVYVCTHYAAMCMSERERDRMGKERTNNNNTNEKQQKKNMNE